MKIDWKKERSWYKFVLKALWVLLLLGILGTAIFFISLSRTGIPSFEDLENPKYDLASIVYDVNNESFGKYYIENREQITYEELSPNILNALLSTEDERFMDHSGIDVRALSRVAFKTLLFQKESSGGGSTITQQLAKLLYKRPSLSNKSTFERMMGLLKIKFREWITAVKLEKSYTKEEILTMYLNKFEFINGAHGIQAAAEIYFAKDQIDLNVSEASTLVGMLQNPSRFNPVRFPDRTMDRRNVVLSQLYEDNYIERADLDSLVIDSIDISNFKRSNHSLGPAPYFRAELTKWLKELLDQPQYAKPEGGKYNIYTDGLKIHTTIDLKYQKHAEDAAKNHLKTLQERYWRVWRGMNPLVFEADSIQKILRHNSVERRIHYSARYLQIFSDHFKDLNSKISKEISGFDLREPPLRQIMATNRPDTIIAKFGKKETRKNYSKLIDLAIWDDIKSQWATFEKAAEENFKTKVDLKLFDYAEGNEITKEISPRDSIMHHMRHLQVGMMAVDPRSGHIKAWVGGVNHKYFKFDHVNNRRQVGSTIKPFVYATAISLQNLSPCHTFEDIQYSIAPGDANFHVDAQWSPANANGLFTGNQYNLYQGLLYSKNSISVKLVKEMGNVEVIRELLDNVGISKSAVNTGGRLLIPRVPSICLGSVDLSVREMTGAYTTFANNGVYTEPVFIDYIEDKNGKVIYRSSPNRKQALNPLYNSVMVDMLRNNTGGRFGLGVKTENGGKTGTTNDYADAWFMGITPELVSGTWVGGDEKWVRFFTLDDGQGFVMARPIFQDFLRRIEKDTTIDHNVNAKFKDPPPGFFDFIDCNKYKELLPEEELQQTKLQKALDNEFDDEFGDEFGGEFTDEFSDDFGNGFEADPNAFPEESIPGQESQIDTTDIPANMESEMDEFDELEDLEPDTIPTIQKILEAIPDTLKRNE